MPTWQSQVRDCRSLESCWGEAQWTHIVMMSLPGYHATCTNQPAAVYFTAYNHPLSSHWARASQLSLSVWLWFILGHWVSNKLHPHPVSPAASSRHHPYPATYHTLPCQVDTFTWGRSQNSAEHKIRHLFWAQMPKFCNRSGVYPFLGVGFNVFSYNAWNLTY